MKQKLRAGNLVRIGQPDVVARFEPAGIGILIKKWKNPAADHNLAGKRVVIWEVLRAGVTDIIAETCLTVIPGNEKRNTRNQKIT
jgi:hypothetical protein